MAQMFSRLRGAAGSREGRGRNRGVLRRALLLAAAAGALALTACEKKAATQAAASASLAFTPVGTYPVANEKLSFTMFAMSAPNVVDLATNDFTKYLEDKTGVHWDFITAPNDASTEKINLLLASNDYPDAFMFKTPNVATYGTKEGILIPLEDLIPANMPNYWAFMQANPELWAQQRQPDGHIYGVASFNECYHCNWFNKMWVNMDILAELGVGVPQTTDEFKAVCEKFLAKYPKGIAVTGSTTGWGEQFVDWFLGSFLINPGQRSAGDYLAVTPDGRIQSVATQSEYRDALRWLNSLYKMGAIYDGGFTQNAEQYKSLVNQPGTQALFVATGFRMALFDPDATPELYKAYRAMPPLAGPTGIRINTEFKYDSLVENKLVITDKCKYPEAVLRWADHFYTLEGYLQYQYGANTDGKDFVLNPPGEVGLNGKPALFKVLNAYSSEPQNHDWQDIGLIYAPAFIRLGEATDPNIDIDTAAGLEKLLIIETETVCEPYSQKPGQWDVIPNRLKFTSEETSETQTMAVEIEKYIEENKVAFIQGRKNLDSDWDAYIAGFDRLSFPRYLEINQTAWDRSQGK